MLAQCCAAHHARCRCVTSTVYIYTYVGRQLSPVLDDRWSWVVFARCLSCAVHHARCCRVTPAGVSHVYGPGNHTDYSITSSPVIGTVRGNLHACSLLCGAPCSVLLCPTRSIVPAGLWTVEPESETCETFGIIPRKKSKSAESPH